MMLFSFIFWIIDVVLTGILSLFLLGLLVVGLLFGIGLLILL